MAIDKGVLEWRYSSVQNAVRALGDFRLQPVFVAPKHQSPMAYISLPLS
jgi:hypothetical protein